jgi:predicted N-acetyltransferase YhbS
MHCEIIITSVNNTELPAVIEWFREHYYGGDNHAAYEHFGDHEQPNGGATLLAKAGDTIAGFVTIRWVSHNLAFQRDNIPLIHHLEVFSDFQAQGIGNRLLAAAEQLIATRATKAGITVGLFDPDGRGVCKGHLPIKQGEIHKIDHDLILWLVKDLARDEQERSSAQHDVAA